MEPNDPKIKELADMMEEAENRRSASEQVKNMFIDSAMKYTHAEFVELANTNQIKWILNAKDKWQMLIGAQRTIFYLFAFTYMFVPLIFITYWSYHNSNWSLMWGILFTLIGIISAMKSSSVLVGLSVPLAIGVWIKYGFSFHQYFTFYFFCLWWGYLFCAMTNALEDAYSKETVLKSKALYNLYAEHGMILIIPNPKKP